jgi:hypothetical protein
MPEESKSALSHLRNHKNEVKLDGFYPLSTHVLKPVDKSSVKPTKITTELIRCNANKNSMKSVAKKKKLCHGCMAKAFKDTDTVPFSEYIVTERNCPCRRYLDPFHANKKS